MAVMLVLKLRKESKCSQIKKIALIMYKKFVQPLHFADLLPETRTDNDDEVINSVWMSDRAEE